MSLLTKFELNPISSFLKMCRNCLTNQRQGKGRNSVERDQKLIRPGEAPNEFAHQIWVQSDQWFAWKCVETDRPITGQETAGIQESMAKSQPGQRKPLMSVITKFELNPISGLTANAWKLLDPSQARKLKEFSRAHGQKSIRPEKAPNDFAHQIGVQFNQWFICKCTKTAWPITGQETVGIQQSMAKSQSGQRRPLMSLLTKFELNPISGLSANARKLLDPSEVRKQWEFNEALPKVNQVWGGP